MLRLVISNSFCARRSLSYISKINTIRFHETYFTSCTPSKIDILVRSRFPNILQKRSAAHQPLTLKTIEDRIMLVLNLCDKIDNSKLHMDSDFFKDLGLDSLDFVEIIIELEDEFLFEIPDGDSDRIKTPRDIHRYICDRNDIIE